MDTTLNEMFLDPAIIDDALAGLGMQGDAVARKAAVAVARNMNKVITREQILMGAASKYFKTDTLKRLRSGDLKLDDFALYIRSAIVAGGGERFILKRNSDSQEVGIKNIDGNSLLEYENLLVTRIRVAYAADAANPANPAGVLYNNINPNLPAAIYAGELEIRIDDGRKYTYPLANFFNPGGSYAALPGYFDVQNLKTPFVIPEQASLEILYILPDGSALGGTNHYLEVQLIGQITSRTRK